MSLNKFLNTAYLYPRKSGAPLQTDWIKPEFRNVIVTLHMDMWWFHTISRIEKETVWAGSQDRWHELKRLRHAVHFWHIRVHDIPRLSTGHINIPLGLIPARIVKTARIHDPEVRRGAVR